MPVTSRRSAFILVVARVVPLAALVFAVVLPATSALAQGAVWPNKPVKIVVTFPPGGAPDTLARILADKWGQSLGQTFTVDNKPGAAGNIAMQEVANSTDGHTLILGHIGTLAVNPYIFAKVPYEMKDFIPITLVSKVPSLYVVHPDLPVKNLTEFVAYAKARPGQLNFAIGSVGSSLHLAGDAFKMQSGVFIVNIPYRGTAPAIQDVLAGQVELMFAAVGNAQAQVRAGKLKALGVTSATRLAAFPDVPAISEVLPGYESSAWFGLFAPAGTPAAVVGKLNAEVARILALADVRERLFAIGAEPMSASPEQFSAMVRADVDKWGKLVRAAGISAD